ncbi:MAG: hypothetical protein WCK58_01820 [Chloroflexota bacterium]
MMRLAATWRSWLPWVAVVAVFLASRLVHLDRDVPPWALAQYQPLDEATYTLPAFNLHQYGTWTHQDAPWVPIEGAPMNVLQSAATAITLTFGWDYWGFRLSSVVFALITFGAMSAVARGMIARARADGAWLPIPGWAILAAVAALLLADFGFLMSARVVEATSGRLAVIAVLLWLVERGTFPGPSPRGRRLLALGALAGLAATFGYLYNAFLVPGVILAATVWAWRTPGGGVRGAVRAAALAGAGSVAAVATYFAWVYAVYGDTPSGWYARWVAAAHDAGRVAGFDPGNLWDIVLGNSFRLDRPLMAIGLATIPVFAWWAWQSRDRLGIAIMALGLGLLAQTTVQSDYPQRKMLVLLPLVVPIVLTGLLRLDAFRVRCSTSRAGSWAWPAWIALAAGAVVLGILLTLPPTTVTWEVLRQVPGFAALRDVRWSGAGASLLMAGAVVGGGALLVMLIGWRRRRVAMAAAAVLMVSMLAPLASIDMRFVFTHVRTTYRDAMIESATVTDGRVTAGGLSFAMQLYGTSRAVLQGYVFGMTTAEYERALVRYYREGRACCMFAYTDGTEGTRWTGLGFRLVRTYPIVLPEGRVVGLYEFTDTAPGG